MKIKNRLILSFSVIIAFLIVTSTVSIVMTSRIQSSYDDLLIAQREFSNMEFESDYMIHMIHHYIEGKDTIQTSNNYEKSKTNYLNASQVLLDLNYFSYTNEVLSELNIVKIHFTNITSLIENTQNGIFNDYDQYISKSDYVHLNYPAVIQSFETIIQKETNNSLREKLYISEYNFERTIHMLHHYIEGNTINSLNTYDLNYNAVISNLDFVYGTTNLTSSDKALISNLKNDISTLNDYIANQNDGIFYYLDLMNYQVNLLHQEFPVLLGHIDDISHLIINLTDTITANASNDVNSTLIIVTSLAFISLLVGIFIVYKTNRAISSPIKILTDASKKIAEGDLTVELDEVTSNDEIGALNNNFLSMKENIKGIISEISQGALVISSSSNELASSTEEENASSEEISSVAQQISKC